MTWNVRIFISPPFQRISITNRVLSLFDCFTTYYNCMTWNFKKLISDISVHKDHKSCSYLIWPFYDLLQHYDIKCQKTHISTIFSAQVSQIVFFPYLTVLQLITTLWPEMSENSYLRHFSAQVSQSVFLAYLTVLRLITIVWPEMSENSYIRDFSAQVSQIVFLVYLTVLRLFQLYDLKCEKTHISALSVHKYHKAFS